MRTDLISLLDADCELRATIPMPDHARATELLLVPCLTLPHGSWDPDLDLPETPDATGLLVAGAMASETVLGGRHSAHLLGPGDVIDPWTPPDTTLPCQVQWTALTPVTIAVLGGGFATAAARWPALGAIFRQRLLEQS